MSVCPQVFFEVNRPGFDKVTGIVRRFLANRERNVLGIRLRATITKMLLYPLSVYIRRTLYEFLMLDIVCISRDGDI